MSSDQSPSPSNLVGLDLVRIVAMGMVVIQHTLSLAERNDLTLIAGLSIGQLGVAIFLVVSGLLSFEGRRSPVSWLSQRLCRVYPAFWIAMVGSFCLAALSGYKHASPGQIVSQMLGTGLWTHPGELVNSPTWFVSLILVCYVATFLARVIGRPALVAAISSVIFAVMVSRDAAPWLLSHCLTYAVSSAIAASASKSSRRSGAFTIAAMLSILAWLVQPAFAYTAIGLVIVEVSLLVHHRPRFVKMAADYSYEFYLVHGVALAGALTVMTTSIVLAVTAALISSAVAAVLLHYVTSFFVRQFWLHWVVSGRSVAGRLAAET